MEYIYYVFYLDSYEIKGPYNFKEANRLLMSETEATQILKLVVDEFGKLV